MTPLLKSTVVAAIAMQLLSSVQTARADDARRQPVLRRQWQDREHAEPLRQKVRGLLERRRAEEAGKLREWAA